MQRQTLTMTRHHHHGNVRASEVSLPYWLASRLQRQDARDLQSPGQNTREMIARIQY